jgi:hypothetical protein
MSTSARLTYNHSIIESTLHWKVFSVPTSFLIQIIFYCIITIYSNLLMQREGGRGGEILYLPQLSFILISIVP